MLLSQRNKLLVVYGTGSDQNHTIRSVVSLDVVGEVIAFDGEDVGLWPKNGPAKGLT